MMKKILSLAAILAVLALPAAAHFYKLGDLRIGHIWIRATASHTGAAYVPIENTGKEDDVLKSAESKSAERIEFHESKIENGIARMRRLDEVKLPAGKKIEFKPGGMHIMLIGLKAPLKPGNHVMITLHFAKAGAIEVDAHVQKTVEHAHDMEGMEDMHDMPGMHH